MTYSLVWGHGWYFKSLSCQWMSSYCSYLCKTLLVIAGRAAPGNPQVNNRASDMDTEWFSTKHRYCFRPVHLNSLCLICSVNLQRLYLDRAWSMIQTNRNRGWQNPVISSICGARLHWVTAFWYLILLTLLMSKVMCCQLAGLIGMECRQSFREEWGVPAHAHLAREQGVELTHILYWGFSKKKGRFGRQSLWLRLPLGFKREQTKHF